jgi:hypothetical protein
MWSKSIFFDRRSPFLLINWAQGKNIIKEFPIECRYNIRNKHSNREDGYEN